jgi:hypothetical protein
LKWIPKGNPTSYHCLGEHLQASTGAQRQNRARTPCGASASFSPCLSGDGGPEACDLGWWAAGMSATAKDLLKNCSTFRASLSLTCQQFVKNKRSKAEEFGKIPVDLGQSLANGH